MFWLTELWSPKEISVYLNPDSPLVPRPMRVRFSVEAVMTTSTLLFSWRYLSVRCQLSPSASLHWTMYTHIDVLGLVGTAAARLSSKPSELTTGGLLPVYSGWTWKSWKDPKRLRSKWSRWRCSNAGRLHTTAVPLFDVATPPLSSNWNRVNVSKIQWECTMRAL